MKEIMKKYIIFIFALTIFLLNSVIFFHNHYYYETTQCEDNHEHSKGHNHKNNCLICIFVKYISNLTFDVSSKIFCVNIFFVVLLIQILKPKFNKTNPFLSRAPPL